MKKNNKNTKIPNKGRAMTPKLCMKNNNNNKKIRITQEEKEDIFEHLPFQPKLLLLIQNCMLIAKDGFVQFLRLDLLVWLTDMKSHCSYTFCGSKKIPQDSQSSGRGKPRGVKTDNCCSFSSQLQIGNRYILVYPTSVLDSQVIFLRSTFSRSIDRIFHFCMLLNQTKQAVRIRHYAAGQMGDNGDSGRG